MNKEVLKTKLERYTGHGVNGVNQYFFKAPFPRFLYSDGVKFLAENADAYWLVDAIAGYQPTMKEHPELSRYQHWTLEQVEPGKALLSVRGHTKDPAPVLARTVLTDFPFDTVKNVTIIVEPNLDDKGECVSACFPAER